MKRFSQFLTESTDSPAINVEHIYGQFRQSGIHAGNRLCETPLVATRGFAALNTAAHRIESILKEHGLILHELHTVDRPKPEYIMMEYNLTHITDERRIIGTLNVKGKVSPIDKGTVQFFAEITLPHMNLI